MINRTFALIALILSTCVAACRAADLPNILWIVAEDINPHLRCFGDTNAITPNLDAFARRSLRYPNCWSTAPVCAPARTALITGVYPPSTGAEHMRSLVSMPAFMRMYPQLLRQRGYYCINNSKEDYNLEKPEQVWDESSGKAHYKHRKPGQPFFAAFNIAVTHESQIRSAPSKAVHNPAEVRIPAYHPDHPEVRRDWARYHDNITAMDEIAGKYLKELEQAGLAEDTIVFFYGDNGAGMPRGKRWLYSSGLNVPLIIHVPNKFKHLAPPDYVAGGSSARLVGFVDFAPTLLSIAGIKPQNWMQGTPFLGQFQTPPCQYLHGFRGRMDERYDTVRSVRNDRYLYIRNYMPHLIYGQHVAYQFETPTTRIWKALYDQNKLTPPQTFFWETKPSEELYDLVSDPEELKNLAGSAGHRAVLEELRRVQREHVLQICDLGFLPEAEQHRRTPEGMSPYEMGHDSRKYPLQRILAMAEAASSQKPEALVLCKEGLSDGDSAVRYWAALGYLMRGKLAIEPARAQMVTLLKDESPSVRIVAAQGLAQAGNRKQQKQSLAVLQELVQTNDVYVRLEALNAVDALGEMGKPLHPGLKSLSDPIGPNRLSGNIQKLLDWILR